MNFMTMLDGAVVLTHVNHHWNDCGWWMMNIICGKLNYNPVFEFEIGTGTKIIDTRGWFESTIRYCQAAFLFGEFNTNPLPGHIFH